MTSTTNIVHASLASELDRGYNPAVDALVVESADRDWTVVPPWRCAMQPTSYLPREGLDTLLVEVRDWHWNCVGGDLTVWVLRRGAMSLEREP